VSPAKAGKPPIDADSSINKERERKAEHPSSKPELTLLDLRRQDDTKKVRSGKGATGGDAVFAEPAKDVLHKVALDPDSSNVQFRELTIDARGTGESGSLTQARSDAEVASGGRQDFQSMLSERLRDQWNSGIVQSAHIVLRDGDAGTIRLRLKPESLGNVKIELNLSDNNISGKIVVESDEAKTAFEKNMNDLSDAFKQGGFDSARLEVSVGSGSGNSPQSQGGRSDSSPDPFFSERLRSAVSSPADPATAASAYSRAGSSVDMFA
jgi:flagellar hook-length control protein FliK